MEKRYFILSLKTILSMCAIIILLSGMALALDRDVIIAYHSPIEKLDKQNIQNHGGKVKKDLQMINAVSASLPEAQIDNMKKDARIKYIVNDSIFKATDEYTNSWGVQYIGNRPVHDQGITGSGIKVAVLDTGIDYNHPDLNGSYKGGYDFVNNDSDPWDDNCLSQFRTCHGTHVSGIIAAEKNGVGIVGVAPGSSIYAIKVLDGGGFGTASKIISGIEWAITNGMNIISMSLTSTENNTAVLDAINVAYNSGILIVAAGGNTYGGPVSYPAAYDSVIAVTAIDQNGQKAGFSPIGQKIEVSAPGVNINSTVQGGYGFLSGTSMAAPYVTGVAALIYSTNFPDINGDGRRDNNDVRQIIDSTAFDVGLPGRDDIYGYGILDASKAVLGYSSSADLAITIDDNISSIIAGDGNVYTYNITVKNNGPSNASGVKLLDTWPVGFIKGTVTPSQGICNNVNNFICDLGNILKGDIAEVTVSYTVPTTSIGNYTNKVEISSTNPDYIVGNNIAEDLNNVIILLALNNRDIANTTLYNGNYSITINNVNLTKIDMKVYENRRLRKDLSTRYNLINNQVIDFNFNVNVTKLYIEFRPFGINDSIASIIIRRL